MDSYDPLLTAAIRFQRSVEGDRSRDHWTATFSRSSTITVSGLLGQETERTRNGTGSGQVTRSRFAAQHEARSYDMSYTSTTSNVVRAVDHAAHPWPLSGSITQDVTAVGTDRNGYP